MAFLSSCTSLCYVLCHRVCCCLVLAHASTARRGDPIAMLAADECGYLRRSLDVNHLGDEGSVQLATALALNTSLLTLG